MKKKKAKTVEAIYIDKKVYITFTSEDNSYVLATYNQDLKGGFFKIDSKDLKR